MQYSNYKPYVEGKKKGAGCLTEMCTEYKKNQTT